VEPADVVLRFLESAGRRSEAEFYINLFRSEAKERFAAIHVSAGVMRHAAEAVAVELRFLAALGLTPVVALGVVDPAEAATHAARLARRLERDGVPAELFAPGPIEATAAARSGILPITLFSGSDDRVARLGAFLAALETRKLIFLTRRGGFQQNGGLLSLVNLTTDTETLLRSRDLTAAEKALLRDARRLTLELVSHKLIVSVTSPFNLLRELFTVKGAGTMIRRGAVIQKLRGLGDIDVDRLRELLVSAFGRPPRPEVFTRSVDDVYLVEDYRGVAVILGTPLGAYLTKFAVGREAQGEGIGRDMWEAIVDDHRVIFWRARADNPINDWYGKLADGLVRMPDWNVFWRGLAPEQIPAAIEYALAAPVDFPGERQ